MDPTETTAPIHSDALTVINGGIEIAVRAVTGEKETIKVRQLPLRLIPRWAELLANEPKLIELYVDRDEAWVDRLLVEDQERIVDLGGQLNYPTFDRWIARLEATTGRALETAKARGVNAEAIKARVEALGRPAPSSPSPSA